MHILVHSNTFAPNIGGMETYAELMAREFAEAGHTVRLITDVPSQFQDDNYPFIVLRRPSILDFIRELNASDVFFQVGLSLKGVAPYIFSCRPLWVVTHHSWMTPHKGGQALLDWKDRLKVWVTKYARNICCSDAIAAGLNTDCIKVNNPYDDRQFTQHPGISRERDFIFVGRLVSDKGADLILEALQRLSAEGLRPSVTIVGDGPERRGLEEMSCKFRLADQVKFTGTLRGHNLARELNRHTSIVIPSRWPEPAGIVALEAMACGCIPIGSDRGGLPEIIGRCGVLFRSEDAGMLANAMKDVLQNHALCEACYRSMPTHLQGYNKRTVAGTCLALIKSWKQPEHQPGLV